MSQYQEHDSRRIAKVTPLHTSAEDNLRYIRTSMEAATAFTGVSGIGFMTAGLSALVAVWVGSMQDSREDWFSVWIMEALLAVSVVLVLTANKAGRQGVSLWSASGKKLFSAFLPTMAAGALLTVAIANEAHYDWLPGIWLALYGAAIMTAGAHSVRIIPIMGSVFLLFAALTLLTPVPPDLMLALGFGGLHLIFGYYIWRHHGG